MAIKKPRWYSNLKLWRTENGCTGELWDIYVEVTTEKIKQVACVYILLGITLGITLSWIYSYLRS